MNTSSRTNSRSRLRASALNSKGPDSSYRKNSTARASKARAPLADIHQIRAAVRALQKDSKEQLGLEQESQATFEFLSSQINALKKAFDTLAEVVMEEVDSVRAESSKRWKNIETEVAKQSQQVHEAMNEVGMAKRAVELWTSKERDWSKDNEVLKVSHAHNAEWMQKMQRDVMDMKDEVREMKNEHALFTKELREEAAHLRVQWDQQVDSLNAKIRQYETAIERQQSDIRSQAEQRMDDLELLQRALSTVQSQQNRVRASAEEAMQAAKTDVQAISAATQKMDNQMTSLTLDNTDLKRKVQDMIQDNRLQFDNVSRVFKIFSDALNMAPPYFPNFQSPSTNLSSSTTTLNHNSMPPAPSSFSAPPPAATMLSSSTNEKQKG